MLAFGVHAGPRVNGSAASADADRRLGLHLRSWVGAWPPPSEGVNVVGDPARLEPTWDGSIRKLQGVGDGRSTVIAVPPDAAEAVAAYVARAKTFEPADAQYLLNHRGHLMFVKPEERDMVTAELIRDMTFTAPRDDLLRRFRDTGNAVLLGTGSFWEGVDVRGDALSLVVIDRLPFASPGDPLLQALHIVRVQDSARTDQSGLAEGIDHLLDRREWIRRIERHFDGGDACVDQCFGYRYGLIGGDPAQDGDDLAGHCVVSLSAA